MLLPKFEAFLSTGYDGIQFTDIYRLLSSGTDKVATRVIEVEHETLKILKEEIPVFEKNLEEL